MDFALVPGTNAYPGGGFKYFLEFSPRKNWGKVFQFEGSHIFQMGGSKTTNHLAILRFCDLFVMVKVT